MVRGSVGPRFSVYTNGLGMGGRVTFSLNKWFGIPKRSGSDFGIKVDKSKGGPKTRRVR